MIAEGADAAMSTLRRAMTWPFRRAARRVTPFLRRVALQARAGTADPGGVGPVLVVGPFEWIPYRTYLRMVETVFEGTRFHLVDTTHKQGQVIDLGRLAQRAFGRLADPVVFFLAGPVAG